MTPYQIITLAIMLTFYTCYYAKKLSQKRRGIQTTQIVKGKTGVHMYTEAAMGAASVAVVIAEITSILSDSTLTPAPVRIAGIAVAIIGLALFVTAMLTMRDSWRAGVSGDKTALVTAGIFKLSRNPAFLGFDLVYIGILTVFFNWFLLIFTTLSVLTLHLQIVVNEEPAMQSAFGDEYLNYKKTVNRYFGRKK